MTGEWDQNVATLRTGQTDPGAAVRLTAIVQARALDEGDAELLLDALGLSGSPGNVFHGQHPGRVADRVCGTQSGVDYHLAMGHAALCRACQRFLDVRERRASGCGEQCSTVQGYWRHRSRREKTCEASRAAYAAYNRAAAVRGREAR